MFTRTGILINHAHHGFTFSRVLPAELPHDVEFIAKFLQAEANVGDLDDAEILVMINGTNNDPPLVTDHWSALNGDFEGFLPEVVPDPFPTIPPPAAE